MVWALLALLAGLSGFAVPAAAQGIDLEEPKQGGWVAPRNGQNRYTVALTKAPTANVTIAIHLEFILPPTGPERRE